MLNFSSTTDPPPYHGAIKRAVQNLCSILGPDPHPEDQGFVVFIESEDLPDTVNKAINKNISTCLMGRNVNCLVGVSFYGNSDCEKASQGHLDY